MRCDMHIHTVVSDGFFTPEDVFRTASRLGLERISITDHDTLGAYSVFGRDLVVWAREFGLELVPGIELDSLYDDVEVHLLGYGMDLHNLKLNTQLEEIRLRRQERTRDQIAQVNAALGELVIQEEDVFLPLRRTYMKPHLLRLLLNRKRFADYREASAWFRDNVRSTVKVPKFPVEEVIGWIREAGGEAVLAHPGYYLVQFGLNLDVVLDRLAPCGLTGVEVEYRYRLTSPHFPDLDAERRMTEVIRQAAAVRGLKATRGSDAHAFKDMEDFDAE